MYEDDIPDGFQLDTGSHGETDITQQWLDAAEAKLDGSNEQPSPDPLMGKATASDLQLGRFSHLEPRIQKGIQSALYGTLDASGIYKRPIEVMAAKETFEGVIGMKASTFADSMKIDESVQDPRSRQDLATVFSVLGNTAGEYLDKGPGSRLAGHSLNEEKMLKKEDGLSLAFKKLDGLAELYIPEEVRESNRYGIVKEQVVNQLTSRLMDEKFFKRAKDAEGWQESPILPLPSEMNIRGLRETGSILHSFTSPHTRLSWSKLLLDKTGSEKFDGFELKQQQPSLMNSLFPIANEDRFRNSEGKNKTTDKARRTQNFNMNTAYKEAFFVHEQLREAFPTHQNESEGVKRATGFTSVYGSQASQDNARNEGSILDLDTHETEFIAARGVVGGSNTGGQYGEKNASELAKFSEAFDDGYDLEGNYVKAADRTNSNGIDISAALEIATGSDADEVKREILDRVPEFDLDTDRGRYQEKMFFNPQPKQGSAEWLKQREGNITASIAGELLGGDAERKMAIKLSEQKLGMAKPFVENSYTKSGNTYEAAVQRAFLSTAGKNLDYEEAYFEQKEGEEGFGVSPDGRLFNKDGSSAGLLELKFLTGKSMKKALSTYTPQMQMQMAIAGEAQTHFYAMNKHTGEYLHEVVKADPAMQEKLLSTGRAAHQISKENSTAAQVVALEKQVKADKIRKPTAASTPKVGEEAIFSHEEPVDEPMTAFDEGDVVRTGKSSGTVSAANSVFGKMLKKESDAAENRKAKEKVLASVEGVEDATDDEAFSLERAKFINDAQRIVSKETQKSAKSAFSGGNRQPNPLDVPVGDSQLANQYRAMQDRDARVGASLKDDTIEAYKENKYRNDVEAAKKAREAVELAKIESAHGEAKRENSYRSSVTSDMNANEIAKAKAKDAQIDRVEKAYQEDHAVAKAENSYRDAVKSSIEKQDKDKDSADLTEAYATNKYMNDVEAATSKNEKKKLDAKEAADASAQKDLDMAAKAASKSLQDMSDSAKQAIGVLVEIGGMVVKGNESGMDEVRLAAETGMDVESTRGMRKVLEKGGMSASGINSTFGAAASMVSGFNNEATAANQWTNILKERGVSNLGAVKNLELPTYDEIKSMNPQELISMVTGMMEGKTPQEKAQIGKIFNMSSLAANTADSEMVLDAWDTTIDKEGLQDTNKGIQTVKQIERDAKEFSGSLGEMSGVAAAGVGVLGAVAGSKSLIAASKSGAGRSMMKAASGSKLAKGLSVAARATPIAAAVTLAPMAARHFGDIEDDGGAADSAMDVLEMAGYGASIGGAVGSVVPVLGTAVGAAVGGAVGAGAGLVNEAYEYFTKDAMPSSDIGSVGTRESQTPVKVDNNVEVNVEIAKDKYEVTTNVNGKELFDMGTGL